MNAGQWLRILMIAWGASILPGPAAAQIFNPVSEWRYVPVDPEFHAATTELLGKDSFLAAIELAQKVRKEKQGSSAEGEARLVIADACEKLGMIYCAFHYSFSTALEYPGSMPALRGLQTVERLLRSHPLSDKRVRQLVNAGSFKEIPDSLGPMVFYMVAIDNAMKNLALWVPATGARIGKDTYWGVRWRFLLALEANRRGDPGTVARLESLLPALEKEPRLAALIRWQLARLYFNQGEFDKSRQLYETLPSDERTGGIILRERAWAHYWRKDYAETLGLIKAGKSPYHALSRDPELYLLEMLTLRRVCHYKTVKFIADEFRSEYSKSIQHVRRRKKLSDDLGLVRMSFTKASLTTEVETVALIRDELRRLPDQVKNFPDDALKELTAVYKAEEASYAEDVAAILNQSIRSEAARLLEIADQVQLIDYLSGLDAHAIEGSNGKREYQAQTGTLQFSTLFWPVTTEYWRDELKNLRVLVNDRCGENGP